MTDLAPLPLPPGVTSRYVETETGLTHHVLEAGDPAAPLLLLLHGFPELAFSWRKIIGTLADAGFHVVAPDQRGYGRTTGWEAGYDADLSAFSMPCLVRDAIALVRAMDHDHAHAVVGHDFGSPVAGWAALIRPDIFRRAVLLSAPFGGPPAIGQREDPVHRDLLALDPPRVHYQWYYSTRAAARDMLHAPQGLHDFLRAYFHVKSADWKENAPHRLAAWTAGELAKLPTYYVMNAAENMAETVAHHMPEIDMIAACDWLTEADLSVFAAAFSRTGFQAALNWYRCGTSDRFRRDLSVFQGRQIEVPVTFISGAQDWGYRQIPGALERMESTACADYRGTYLVENAGHWVQQEQPGAVVAHILGFLGKG